MNFDIKNLVAQIKGNQNKKLAAIGLIAAVLVIADIFFIFLPLLGKNFKIKTQILSLKKNTEALNRQFSDINGIKERLAAVKAERESYNLIFPKEEEVPVLLGGISAIAGKTSIDIIAVKPVKLENSRDTAESTAVFHEVPIEIFAKGGYHQIGQFINKLESLDKFVEIKDIEITADKATPRRHFFRLLVSTYVLRT